MKALCLKLGSITAFMVLLSGVAFAKGPGLRHVTLDGPGIGHPVRVEEHYPDVLGILLDDAIGMHLFGSASRKDIARHRAPIADLGPRFQLSYHMGGKPVEIDFYPYADEGPLAYASRGQSVPVPIGQTGEDYEFPVRAGWYDYRPAIGDLLQEEGLPTENEIDDGAASASVLMVATLFMSLTAALVGLRHRWRCWEARDLVYSAFGLGTNGTPPPVSNPTQTEPEQQISGA
jgi:hypothetical protein